MPTQHLSTGIDLYYETHGDGEPIVFIPGTGCPGDVWKMYQVPDLSKDLKVIIFDQRGTGQSTRYKGTYSMEQLAADTFALLDHLQIDRAHILGHSMGGRIALAMALLFPERISSLVLAAAGSGPATFPGPAGPSALPGLPEQLVTSLIQLGYEGYSHRGVFESTVYFTDEFRENNPSVLQAFWDDYYWPGHAGIVEYIQQCIARHNWEATYRLGEITARTLVLVGDQDILHRSHVPQAEVLAASIPNATYKVLKNQSHGFFWQIPEETNQLLRDWVAGSI